MAKGERRSAEEWRRAILDAAIVEFAARGFHGTSTERIAARVGISQPYVFRLFGSKKALFLAAVEQVIRRIIAIFGAAARERPEAPLPAMGQAYRRLLARSDELRLLLQAFAACADPEIQAVARRQFGEVYQEVEKLSGASDSEVREFMAIGMLLTVAAALELPAILDDEAWARRCLNPGG